MQVLYSELINRFQDLLGIQKNLIEETFNKPDATDVVLDKYISVKNFGSYCILIIFEMGDQTLKFLNAHRIYPKLLNGNDVSKMKPLDLLLEFMNIYGISRTVPGFGEHKVFVERKMKIFFPGILDIEKYMEALKNI